MDWRSKAACLDAVAEATMFGLEQPMELFFPVGTGEMAQRQTEVAKQVCRRCDVRDSCLTFALETSQDAGVWGGMGEEERRAYKRRVARTRLRTTA
jgi:WhiB family redox-sensing transcriptional regulator